MNDRSRIKNITTLSRDSCQEYSSLSRVTFASDPFSYQYFIFGKVYLECCDSVIIGSNKEGISGVKLTSHTGEIIITDKTGRYYFTCSGEQLREHDGHVILTLDAGSLPQGYQVVGRNTAIIQLRLDCPEKIDFKITKVI